MLHCIHISTSMFYYINLYVLACSIVYIYLQECSIISTYIPSLQLELVFTDFNMESNFDFLMISLMDTLTGSSQPMTYASEGNVLTLVMRSDGSVTMDGFQAVVTMIRIATGTLVLFLITVSTTNSIYVNIEKRDLNIII